MRIGVLALQGDFALHARALEKCGVEAVEVRKPIELDGVDGLIRRGGPGVEVLAEHGGEPVMARQDRVLVATFHPELTDSTAVHRYFCDLVERSKTAP